MLYVNTGTSLRCPLDTSDADRLAQAAIQAPNDGPYLFSYSFTGYGCGSLLAVEVSGDVNLKHVLAALLEAEINIHYVYAFTRRPEGRTAFALHVEDGEIGAQALGHRGFKVLTQRDISR